MKLIILDRDGVVNQESDHYIKSVDEWHPIAGSLAAIGKLKKAGYQVALATNQSGIARGYYDLATLHAIHNKMQQHLAEYDAQVDFIAFCPHHPEANCACRKPKNGLLQQIAQHYQTTLTNIAFIGDSLKDMQAGLQSNCSLVLVKTGRGLQTLASPDLPQHVSVFDNLAHYVDQLLANNFKRN